jgi:hypothetical protein
MAFAYQCLKEAELICKTISLCKNRQLNSDDVRQYLLPAVKHVFERQRKSMDVSTYAIYDFVYSLARTRTDYDPTLMLFGESGMRCLCDGLLIAAGLGGNIPEQVRNMSALLLPVCPCFTPCLVSIGSIRQFCFVRVPA